MAARNRLTTEIDTIFNGRGAEEAKRSVDNLNSSVTDGGMKWTEIASKVSLAQAAFSAVSEAGEMAYGVLKGGAELQLSEERFGNLTRKINTTADALKNDLVAAVKGTRSEAELMAGASDLMGLGLVKTHDQTVRMTRAVGALNMDMNALTLTLTNQTTARFDTLGVATDGFKERLEALKATGLDTNAAFTEAFLQQAEEQIEIVGDAADSTSGDLMRMEANVANLKNSLSILVANGLAPAASSAAILSGQLVDMTTVTKDGRTGFEQFAIAAAEANKAVFGVQGVMGIYADKVRDAEKKQNDFTEAAFLTSSELANMTQEIEAAVGADQLLAQYVSNSTIELIARTEKAVRGAEGIAAYHRETSTWLTTEEAAAVALQNTASEMGNMTAATATGTAAVQSLTERVAAIEGRHTVTINLEAFGLDKLKQAKRLMDSLRGMNTNDQPDPFNPVGPTLPGDDMVRPPEFASGTGGWMTVPGAFGQPYHITVHGGEQMNVVPAGQTQQAQPQMAVTQNFYNTTPSPATMKTYAQAAFEMPRG